MSSSGSPPGGERPEPSSRRGSATIWHPAREWLEEDEDDEDLDLDYVPGSGHSEDEGIDDDADVGAQFGNLATFLCRAFLFYLLYKMLMLQPSYGGRPGTAFRKYPDRICDGLRPRKYRRRSG